VMTALLKKFPATPRRFTKHQRDIIYQWRNRMSDFEPVKKDPIDDYDSKHGSVKPDPILSEADAWGTKLNPVQETPLEAVNLKVLR
jgi:hypothetical protein